jgi:hypothetical protein
MTLLVAGSALAADPTPAPSEPTPAQAAPPNPTPEQRQTMAAAHRRMAECLESNRTWTECHAEMHATCQQTIGAQGCPMMGRGMGMGMGPGGGMRHGQGPPPSPPPQP